MRRARSAAPVLIVLHQETSTPGRVGNALRLLGHPLDISRPRFGDPLPETLDDHAGAVIFGGPMSANDPDDFVRREIDWISVPLKEERPFLGICLGAQMLAMQLGATRRAASRTAAPRSATIRSARPRRALRSARTGRSTSITGIARVLTCRRAPNCWPRAATFPVEAFRAGHSFGFQFHPDVTTAMMHRWTTRGHERLALPGARPRRDHFCASRAARRGRARVAEAFSRWLAGADAAGGAVTRCGRRRSS